MSKRESFRRSMADVESTYSGDRSAAGTPPLRSSLLQLELGSAKRLHSYQRSDTAPTPPTALMSLPTTKDILVMESAKREREMRELILEQSAQLERSTMMEAELKRLKDLCRSQDEHINKIQNLLNDAVHDKETSQQRQAEIESERTALRLQVAQSEWDIAEERRRADSAMVNLTAATQQIFQLKTKLQDLTETHERCEEEMTRTALIKKKAWDLEYQNRTLKEEMEWLRDHVSDLESFGREYEIMKLQKEELEHRYAYARRDFVDLSSDEALRRIQQEGESALVRDILVPAYLEMRKRAQLSDDVALLHKEIETLQSKARNDEAEFNRALRASHIELTNVKKDLAAAETKIDDINATHERSTNDRIIELTHEVEALNKNLETSKRTVAEMREVFAETNNHSITMIQQLTDRYNASVKVNDSLNTHISQLEAEHAANKLHATEQINILQTFLDQSKRSVKELEASIAANNDAVTVKGLQDKVMHLQVQLEDERRRVAAYEAERSSFSPATIVALKNELERAQVNAEAAAHENFDLKNRLEHESKQVQKATDLLRHMDGQLESTYTTLSSMLQVSEEKRRLLENDNNKLRLELSKISPVTPSDVITSPKEVKEPL
eukprot:PhF_6_TR22339/c0_g1_i1/m.31630